MPIVCVATDRRLVKSSTHAVIGQCPSLLIGMTPETMTSASAEQRRPQQGDDAQPPAPRS